MAYYPEPVARLIDALQRLPGIGPKTAQRLTFFLLKRPTDEVRELSSSLMAVKEQIVYCSTCFNVTDQNPCRICSDPARDSGLLCVVEEPNDLLAMERTGEFKGRYHVLLGALSPLDGIGPDDLKVRELLQRLDAGGATEVILATNPNVEGEATVGGGMVTVEANGKQELLSIKIDPEVINKDDAQMLEDLVLAACNE
ncbi:MAG TPA: recombination mediator RecR, partial [Methylomirabilota bacterium]|nr:recombination mediator RecR [Methylomirabilota bacterium]